MHWVRDCREASLCSSPLHRCVVDWNTGYREACTVNSIYFTLPDIEFTGHVWPTPQASRKQILPAKVKHPLPNENAKLHVYAVL